MNEMVGPNLYLTDVVSIFFLSMQLKNVIHIQARQSVLAQALKVFVAYGSRLEPMDQEYVRVQPLKGC